MLPLHGTLDSEAQDAVLAPSARRKVVLATNVAETSLTIDGVTEVVDSGLVKVLRFDPTTGLDRLDTERVSLDSAVQRAGRAGRTAPGRATRLWDVRDRLRPHREADVQRIDLAGPLLDISGVGRRPPSASAGSSLRPGERVEAALERAASPGRRGGAAADCPGPRPARLAAATAPRALSARGGRRSPGLAGGGPSGRAAGRGQARRSAHHRLGRAEFGRSMERGSGQRAVGGTRARAFGT